MRYRFEWWSELGDRPVVMDDGITRLSDRKRLWKLCRLIYLTVKRSIVKDGRSTDHYPRSRAWITALQGPDHSRVNTSWSNGSLTTMKYGRIWKQAGRVDRQDNQLCEVSEVTAIRPWMPDVDATDIPRSILGVCRWVV